MFCGGHCDRFFSRYFGFPLSLSFHQCSILISTYVLHLPRSLGTFQITRLFRMSGAWDRKLVTVAAFVSPFAFFFPPKLLQYRFFAYLIVNYSPYLLTHLSLRLRTAPLLYLASFLIAESESPARLILRPATGLDFEAVRSTFHPHTSLHKIVVNLSFNLPYILESIPHSFYSFRGLKNQMRVRIAVVSWILEKMIEPLYVP